MLFFESLASSVVQQNAATLFYREASEMFCRLQHLLYISMEGGEDK